MYVKPQQDVNSLKNCKCKYNTSTFCSFVLQAVSGLVDQTQDKGNMRVSISYTACV
jgi:hypothetical protein